jgi:hypothetical protein
MLKIINKVKKLLLFFVIPLQFFIFIFFWIWFSDTAKINNVKISDTFSSELNVLLSHLEKEEYFQQLSNFTEMCKKFNCNVKKIARDEYKVDVNTKAIGHRIIKFDGIIKSLSTSYSKEYLIKGFINAPNTTNWTRPEEIEGSVKIFKSKDEIPNITIVTNFNSKYIERFKHHFLRSFAEATLEAIQINLFWTLLDKEKIEKLSTFKPI